MIIYNREFSYLVTVIIIENVLNHVVKAGKKNCGRKICIIAKIVLQKSAVSRYIYIITKIVLEA